jgi:ATP-dependent Clp protease adaptor protein ClpS
MSKRKMAGKTRYCIIVHNDEENSHEDVVELFRIVLGYDPIQAQQCAYLVHNNGEYAVKTFKNKQDAEAIYEQFIKNGINTEIRLSKH